ncbi:MAG: hypothetical protein O2971_11160 [Proteobacteria bacterium]|nr:hypothetical protein [Pseudomonadota bacterium]
MTNSQDADTEIDWSKTTWEGSRREQLRQWQKLSLRERLQTLDEMNRLSDRLAELRARGSDPRK